MESLHCNGRVTLHTRAAPPRNALIPALFPVARAPRPLSSPVAREVLKRKESLVTLAPLEVSDDP